MEAEREADELAEKKEKKDKAPPKKDESTPKKGDEKEPTTNKGDEKAEPTTKDEKADSVPPTTTESGKPLVTEAEIKKMRTKQLRTFLYARGVTCKGCAEKDDFVKMAMESRHLKTKDEEEEDQQRTDEMMRNMRDKGANAYGGGDLGQKGYGAGANSDWKELTEKMGKAGGVDHKEIKEKSKENTGKQFPADEKKEKKQPGSTDLHGHVNTEPQTAEDVAVKSDL